MKKRILLTAVVAIAVFGAIFAYKYVQIRGAMAARASMARTAPTVSTTVARAETWPNTLSSVGTLASFRGITVKTEAEGVIRQIACESGAAVEAGALLIALDDSVETASLPGLEAQAKLAEINLKRARELHTNGTNTVSELDAAEALYAQTSAAVAQLRATLAKKRVHAPFAGRLGIAQVYPGQFLSKGDAVVQLETLDPIHVDFSLPQQNLDRVAVGQAVRVVVDAFPDKVFEGKITAANPRLSETTRSIGLRATLTNPGEVLRPGMFAKVEVVLPASEHYVVLPTASIIYNPYGNAVFVVEAGVAKQRFVQTGPQRGNLVAILSGLKAGEHVVTSGQIKLRNNVPVQVNNAITPSDNPSPSPKES